MKRRIRLVSATSAYLLSQKIYLGDTNPSSVYDPRLREQTWQMMRTSRRDPYRGFASTIFPALDYLAKSAQFGISCLGCEMACYLNFRVDPKGLTVSELQARRDTVFSHAEFELHMRQCDGIQRFRTMRQGVRMEAESYWFSLVDYNLRRTPRTSSILLIPQP